MFRNIFNLEFVSLKKLLFLISQEKLKNDSKSKICHGEREFAYNCNEYFIVCYCVAQHLTYNISLYKLIHLLSEYWNHLNTRQSVVRCSDARFQRITSEYRTSFLMVKHFNHLNTSLFLNGYHFDRHLQ
jgi:hypothetical protein